MRHQCSQAAGDGAEESKGGDAAEVRKSGDDAELEMVGWRMQLYGAVLVPTLDASVTHVLSAGQPPLAAMGDASKALRPGAATRRPRGRADSLGYRTLNRIFRVRLPPLLTQAAASRSGDRRAAESAARAPCACSAVCRGRVSHLSPACSRALGFVLHPGWAEPRPRSCFSQHGSGQYLEKHVVSVGWVRHCIEGRKYDSPERQLGWQIPLV